MIESDIKAYFSKKAARQTNQQLVHTDTADLAMVFKEKYKDKLDDFVDVLAGLTWK